MAVASPLLVVLCISLIANVEYGQGMPTEKFNRTMELDHEDDHSSENENLVDDISSTELKQLVWKQTPCFDEDPPTEEPLTEEPEEVETRARRSIDNSLDYLKMPGVAVCWELTAS